MAEPCGGVGLDVWLSGWLSCAAEPGRPGRFLALEMVALCGGVGLGDLCCAETPSRASYGLTVACRTDERGSAADDGQANDARLSQTVGATQIAQPDSLGGAK
jgi:hypothetical protein